MLVQDADVASSTRRRSQGRHQARAHAEETRALLFAWKVCKHVKSNAIVYARDGQTVGVALDRWPRRFRQNRSHEGPTSAERHSRGLRRFFPFPDGVEEIAKAGATAIIQPGGSQRDPEVIAAADRSDWPCSSPESATSATKQSLIPLIV